MHRRSSSDRCRPPVCQRNPVDRGSTPNTVCPMASSQESPVPTAAPIESASSWQPHHRSLQTTRFSRFQTSIVPFGLCPLGEATSQSNESAAELPRGSGDRAGGLRTGCRTRSHRRFTHRHVTAVHVECFFALRSHGIASLSRGEASAALTTRTPLPHSIPTPRRSDGERTLGEEIGHGE